MNLFGFRLPNTKPGTQPSAPGVFTYGGLNTRNRLPRWSTLMIWTRSLLLQSISSSWWAKNFDNDLTHGSFWKIKNINLLENPRLKSLQEYVVHKISFSANFSWAALYVTISHRGSSLLHDRGLNPGSCYCNFRTLHLGFSKAIYMPEYPEPQCYHGVYYFTEQHHILEQG